MKRFLGFRVLLIVGIWFGCFGLKAQDTKILDSLLTEAKKPMPDTNQVKTYLAIASYYIQTLNAAKVAEYSEKALQISEKAKFKVGISRSYVGLALAEYDKGNYPQSYAYGLRALKVAQENNLWAQVASSNSHLGRVSMAMNNLESAKKFYENAISIAEKKLKDDNQIAASYNSLAIIARRQKRYDEAISYYNRALQIYIKNNRQTARYTVLNNIAGVYFENKEYDKAMENFNQVLKYSKDNKVINLGLIATLNIGECLTEMRQFNKAAPYLYEVLFATKKYSFPELKKENLEYLYKFHFYQSNSDSALFYHLLFTNFKDSLINSENQERIRRMEELHNSRSLQEKMTALQMNQLLSQLQIENEKEKIRRLEADSILQSKSMAALVLENQRIALEEEKRRVEEEKLLQENVILKKDKQLQRYFLLFGIIGFVLALLSAALAFVILKTSRRRKADLALLVKQNIEIQRISDEIQTQKKEIEAKNEELKTQSLLIGKSLQAANTIQQAMLPYDSRMREVFGDFFAIYLPRDVVSGDFYWMAKVDSKVVLAVADCTGHGVPGAFMAMIGYAILDKIILLQENYDPAAILRELHNEILFAFRNQSSGEASGMDISVMSFEEFEPDFFRVVFAGAKSDLLYATPSQNSVLRIRGNNATIGSLRGLKYRFKNHVLFLEKGTMIYLSSDGFSDQINPEKTRFGRSNFMKKLSSIKNLPLSEQQRSLEKTLEDFKKEAEQRDDILVLGLRL
jgi:serine phosphatase RsbU (regulator of sigma subunit)/tetratricopeptide (TPR) repeat protein